VHEHSFQYRGVNVPTSVLESWDRIEAFRQGVDLILDAQATPVSLFLGYHQVLAWDGSTFEPEEKEVTGA
jgi:hypothetical protein